MDPITRASKVFLKEAAACWKARRGHVLFMEADASSRGDLVKTLRLAEWDPSCRRPLFLFEGEFTEARGYFAALSAKMVRDYEELRRGAAEEGVPLPELEARPGSGDEEPSAPALAGSRARSIVRAIEGKLEGIDIALVPKRVSMRPAFRDAAALLAAAVVTPGGGLRLLVLDAPGGVPSPIAEGRTAHFRVDPDELAAYLKDLGNGNTESERAPAPASRELRDLILAAAQASRLGDHTGAERSLAQARTICQRRGWAVEEAALLVAMAGALLAAGAMDRAAATYHLAFTRATQNGASPLAAQAALGEGAVRMLQRRPVEAIHAYARAGEAAERGQIPMLQVEACRMEGVAREASSRAKVVHGWVPGAPRLR